MKKLLTLMAICLLITGCSRKEYDLNNETVKITEDEKAYISYIIQLSMNYTTDNVVADGLRVLNCDDPDNIHSEDTVIYPVFNNDVLTDVILKQDEYSVVSLDESTPCSDEDEIAFVSINDNIYLVRNGEFKMVCMKNDADDKDRKIMKRLANCHMLTAKSVRVNAFKAVENPDTFIDEDGRIYSSKRIVVKFAEGDYEKYISEYEQFCGGTLHSSIKSINQYVFEFDAKTVIQMKELVEKSNALDYVVNASLDGVNQIQPVNNVVDR